MAEEDVQNRPAYEVQVESIHFGEKFDEELEVDVVRPPDDDE